MLKSVSKVCKSYSGFVHTLGVLLIKPITKCKTGTISVYKVGKSEYMVVKSTPKVCTRLQKVCPKCVNHTLFTLLAYF